LFFDGFAVEEKPVGDQPGKPRFRGYLLEEALLTCATVREALALLDRYSRHFMRRFQVLLADAGGDAAIVEGEAVIRKTGPFLIVTNFRQSHTLPAEITCPRYRIAGDMLSRSTVIDRNLIRRILAATHSEGGFATQYSNIYDLRDRRVYLYNFHNFTEEVVIDLAVELSNRTGVRELRSLFGPNHAANRFLAGYTELTRTFAHESVPRFTLGYPEVCEPAEALGPGQVFMAMGRYGQVPALSAAVTTARADLPPALVGGLFFAPRLRQMGDRVKIIANHAARLADGTPVYETRFTWRWQKRERLNTLLLSTVRDQQLVTVALHHTGELEHLKHLPYSLSFNTGGK
jgi:hypothetical protein